MSSRPITRPRSVAAFGTAFAVAAVLAVAGAAQATAAAPPSDAAILASAIPAGSADGGTAVEVLADDPQITMEVTETSEWAMRREGLSVFSWGFTPEVTVTVAVNESVLTEAAANSSGDLNFSFTLGLAPGEHILTLTSSEGGSASHSFTVVPDEEFYDDEHRALFDPSARASRMVVSESELAEEPIRVTGSGFPHSSNPVGPTTVDLLLDGEFLDTLNTDVLGSVRAEFSGPLSPGTHEIVLVSPVGEAVTSFEVVPDAQGALPPAGTYSGSSLQTHADGVELDDQQERAFRFEIDANGRISDVQGEYWWFCAGDSGFKDIAVTGFPATPITSDRPFEIRWHNYILYGTVSADGTASGTFWDGMGECGSSILNWSTEFEGELPEPVYDPEAAVSPSSLTESELADTGVEFAGTGFAPESEVTLTIAGTEIESGTADADGSVSFAYVSDVLGVGVHEAVLASVDGEATVSFTVVEDEEPVPGTIPGVAPVEGDLDPALEGAISVPAEAEPGETITVTLDGVQTGTDVGVWLFSDPVVYLGTRTVDGNGQVAVTIPADTELGEVKIGVWAEADPDVQIGWAEISIHDGGDGPGNGDGDGGDGADGDGDGTDGDGIDGDGTDGGGDDGDASDGTDGDGDDLAVTGGASMVLPLALGALLLAAGAALAVHARRRVREWRVLS